MKGALSEGVLPGLLRDPYVGRKTGLLHFSRGDERRSVLFRKGHMVRAYTNLKEDRLGETLVRLGLLRPEDLERATAIVLREKKRLGLVLQELGVMDKGRIDDAMAVHVREILQKVFAWGDGTYEFEEQDPDAPLDEDITLKVSTGEVILEAVRRVQDPDVVRYALGDVDRVLGLSTDPLLRFQKITLSPADGYVLSRIDGTLSAREIEQMIPMVPEEVEKSLFGLLCTGVIEYLPVPPKKQAARPVTPPATPRPMPPATTTTPTTPRPIPPAPTTTRSTPSAPPAKPSAGTPAAESRESATLRQEILEAHEGLRTKDHFGVLGIPKASNEAQVKEAYFRLAKRFHPDVHHDPALADLRNKLEAVFIRLGEAYEVLRNPRTRAAYESDLASRAPRTPRDPAAASADVPPPPDPEAEARLAQESIRKAEKYFEQEKYWDAIQLLEAALPAAPARSRQRARVLLAKAYIKNPKWVKRGEETLLEVVHDDPRNVEAHFLLGTIYRGSGLRARAAHMFQRVVELDPAHEAARTELAAVQPEGPEPETQSGGLLKKFFGKT